MASERSVGDEADDAARWWQAYLLAEHDQVDELRERAAAGDGHARRQLASWLSDRARTPEAIEAIRPLADAGDDVAELWLVRWLADDDRLDELRERAAGGSYYGPHELAKVLAAHDLHDELRERAFSGGGHDALRELAKLLAAGDRHDELRELATAADPEQRSLILDAAGEGCSGGLDVLRVLADLGDKRGRFWLARRLAREGHLDELLDRAASGDECAEHWLAEALAES
jgi:hypothetical protein